MGRHSALLVFLAASAAASADRVNPGVVWGSWHVTTSCSPQGLNNRYPLANLFDGNPRTAWVFEHQPSLEMMEGDTLHSIDLEMNKPTVIDGLRLMNGYNKDSRTFYRNNRAVKLQILATEADSYSLKLIKETWLKDTMGWHDIRLPRRAYSNLTVRVAGVRKGVENDLCLSELQLTKSGRAIPWELHRAYLYTEGSDCG